VQTNNKLRIDFLNCFAFVFLLIPSLSNAADKVAVFPSQRFVNEYLFMQELKKNRLFDVILEPMSAELIFESRECGFVNAFYSPAQNKITLCYEYINSANSEIDYLYSRETIHSRSVLKTGVLLALLLHELGHAMIHVKSIPVIGNQEDAADSIATIIMLELIKKSPQQGKAMIVGSLAHDWGKRTSGFNKFMYGNDLFADEHPYNEQRVFNRVCLAYGSNQALFIDSARQLKLPESRARRCQKEYQDTKRAVDQLILKQIQ